MMSIAQADEPEGGECYTVYEIEQSTLVESYFLGTQQAQSAMTNYNVHVKRVLVTRDDIQWLAENPGSTDINAYVFLIESAYEGTVIAEPDSGSNMEIPEEEQYDQDFPNPFLVIVEEASGELIDLKSAATAERVQNTYLGFYDIFQYAEHSGSYRYRNANGYYNSQVTVQAELGEIEKVNKNYLPASDGVPATILDSKVNYILDSDQNHCFFKEAKGHDVVSKTLASNAVVDIEARFTVKSNEVLKFPVGHYFHDLSGNVEYWPVEQAESIVISREEALRRLSSLIRMLDDSVENDSEFLVALAENDELWSFLSEYIADHGLRNETSRLLFWALDRIDSRDSVSALAQLMTNQLSSRDAYRAALALGSTSAEFADDQLRSLLDYVDYFDYRVELPSEHLVFIRMMGAMAANRDLEYPIQSAQIREALYSQVNTQDTVKQVAIIDSIGNLGSAIDAVGQELLLAKSGDTVPSVRHAAVSAFTRLPYDSELGVEFIDRMNQEADPKVQMEWLRVLSNADKSDQTVKSEIMSRINDPVLGTMALTSLRDIDYLYNSQEVSVLEEKISTELNPKRQQLLATLILKHRRRVNLHSPDF